MKKLIALLLTLCLVVPAVNAQAASMKITYGGKTRTYTGKQLKVNCNGKAVNVSKTPGILENGTALLPYADTFKNKLSVKSVYNKAKKTITFSYNDKTVKLTLNSKTALVNGKKKTMSVAPKFIRFQNSNVERLMVPSRFTAENLGISYSYDSKTATVTMKNKTAVSASTGSAANKISYGGKTYTYTKKKATVTVNGKKISSVMPGYIINNITLVPAYDTFAKTELQANYSNKSGTITISNDNHKIVMKLGSKTATVDGKKKTMDEAAWLVKRQDTGNSRVMVPGSFVAQALGYKYTWANSDVTAKITGNVPGEDPVDPVDPEPSDNGERKAVWISYLELGASSKSEAKFKNMIDEMFDKSKGLGMNTVIVHVRPFADALYPSSYFPWSSYISGTQGKDPGYDPLEYMVSAAHERDLRFEAWLNPYRVTLGTTSVSKLSSDNIAKKWYQSKNANTKRNVLAYNNNLYFNPAKTEVQNLIVNGIKEIVQNYDVDAIHLDDYFYPSFSKSNVSTAFDATEYKKSGSSASIASWRRSNVNSLVTKIYKAVKAINPSVEFGISPAGNMDNLTSDLQHYVDIKKWLSNDGYVDYICPQIYWGFENGTYSYDKVLDRWVTLNKAGKVKLYVGIANYKAGSSDTSEWKSKNDILKRQILYGRETGAVDGYAFFSYSYLFNSRAKKETANLLSVLNNE